MSADHVSDLEEIATAWQRPVLIVSTIVGRGMYTLGQAVLERCEDRERTAHIAIEDCLPANAVAEDLQRYRLISNRMPVLLNLVYRVPFFYRRKYVRECGREASDLSALRARIADFGPRTVVCVSHRPAFWVSALKRRTAMEFELWGLLGEYGHTLGWKYLSWDQMDGFLSPVERGGLGYPFPDDLEFRRIQLPARRAYYDLAHRPGEPNAVLLVCGYWGQGPLVKIVDAMLEESAQLSVMVVCGENSAAVNRARRAFGLYPNVHVYGVVDSLLPLLAQCACVVTKPGISTLLEAHAAQRKVFLLKGMPVAEDNNARHAIEHWGAEWFTRERFRRWLRADAGSFASNATGH